MQICLRPSIYGIEEVVLLRTHPQTLHTVHSPVDRSCIGTCEVLQHETNQGQSFYSDLSQTWIQQVDNEESFDWFYTLELVLQDAGDVEAEVGTKSQEAVKEENQEAIISWKNQNTIKLTYYKTSQYSVGISWWKRVFDGLSQASATFATQKGIKWA